MKECELIEGGHTFGLLAVTKYCTTERLLSLGTAIKTFFYVLKPFPNKTTVYLYKRLSYGWFVVRHEVKLKLLATFKTLKALT